MKKEIELVEQSKQSEIWCYELVAYDKSMTVWDSKSIQAYNMNDIDNFITIWMKSDKNIVLVDIQARD